jgi:lipopolysaccharide export system permease protein
VKILDKYLLKSFLITFTTVFVILFFIFVLQVVWLFISELAGKDLDIFMIVKFLLFKMPSIIPLVLPLSVLLASIMTFGSLAENYEFAAMKSSGISLQRAMRSLTYFIVILSIVAFIFANNVIPFAEYKFINFRRNIAQVKPAMAIAEGQFSEVGLYNIKVEKKSGENGRFLSQVTIHKKSISGSGSNTVIKAKKGELISNEDSNVLKLVLKDGNYYEDIIPKKFEERNKVPFAKSEFKRYVINIDLSKLNNANLDEEQITNTNTMLTVGELKFTLDSLQKNYKKDLISYTENISQRATITNRATVDTASAAILNFNNVLQGYTNSEKSNILKVATSNIESINFTLETNKYEMQDKQKNINQHWIALYDKFVIAYACLLMFFIGAPLGAIIRKGGLGLPIVFAILIFIIFHFINTFGKKVAGQGELSPFIGCWMSSFVLTPLAILLTKRATDDKGFSINFDGLTAIFTRFFPASTTDPLTPQIANAELVDNLDAKEIKAYINTKPIDNKNNNSVTSETFNLISIETLIQQYKKFSLISLLSYFILLGLFIFGNIKSIVILVCIIIFATIFYIILIKSYQKLQLICKQTKSQIDIHLLVILATGFPFYILFYIYNRFFINQFISASKTTS